jgi:hypothetical protein
MGHFGAKKTEQVLVDHFFWPKMRRESRLNPHVLYTPLLIPSVP